MEKKPAMMDVMMMAIFLDSSSRYSLSRSFSSSISSSSSSSSSDSLSELSSSGSSMLSSLGLSILYWKRGSFDFVSFYSLFVMFALLLPFLVVFDELPPALLLVSWKCWTFNFEITFVSFISQIYVSTPGTNEQAFFTSSRVRVGFEQGCSKKSEYRVEQRVAKSAMNIL